METNKEQKKELSKEEEELEKLRLLAEETKKAQATIEKSLKEKEDELLKQKNEISNKIQEIEGEQSKILEENQPETTEESEELKPESSEIEKQPEENIAKEPPTKTERQDKENANPDGNGTQVLLGDTSDQYIQEQPVEAVTKPATENNTTPDTANEIVPKEVPKAQELPTDVSQIIPEEVGAQVEQPQTTETIQPTLQPNPEIEVIPANSNSEATGEETTNETKDFADNVLQQFPNESPVQETGVGPTPVDSPVGDDGELLQPDFSFEENIPKEIEEDKNKNILESNTQNLPETLAEVPNQEKAKNVEPNSEVITQTVGSKEATPSAIHPTVQPLATNYRSIDDMVAADNKVKQNISNVQNINNVENNIDQSTSNTQNNEIVPEKEEEKKPEEKKKEEIKKIELVQNQIPQSNSSGLPPLPTGQVTNTQETKVNKVETNVTKQVETAKNPPKGKPTSPGTSDIILILLLIVSLVMIGTIIYFSYIQTPAEGSIWLEVRQNIDNFRSALGI